MILNDPNRLFPIGERAKKIAKIYLMICDLPIISPHGHCDPRWFSENVRFPDPAELFVITVITSLEC